MDTDGSETLSVQISGVPAGATLSAGTQTEAGSWSVSAAQLSGLTLTPPAHSDSDFALTVTATATESANSDTASTTDSLQVNVAAVADPPQLTAMDATGQADTPVPLEISSTLTDTDGSETLSVVIGVPAGSQLSAGTNNGDGTWTLTGAQLDGITFTPPPGAEGPQTLTVTATATESSNGDAAQATDTLTVSLPTTNDPPTISSIADQSTPEDTPIGTVSFTVGDEETPVADLVVIATSDNVSLIPNANIVLGGSGANRTIGVTPAANQSGSATVTVSVRDSGGLQASETFVVTVSPVNDLPTISNIPDQATTAGTPTAALPFTIGDLETAAIV